MLAITSTSGEVAVIKGQEVQIVSTLGSLATLNFIFYNDLTNFKSGEVLAPFSVVSVPENNEDYLIQTVQTDTIGDYIQYTVTGVQIATRFHYKFVKDKIGITASKSTSSDSSDTTNVPVDITLQQGLDHIFTDSGFTVNTDGLNTSDKRLFSDGFGGDYADSLLQNLATSFGLEFYWQNTTCFLKKQIGDDNKFVFIDNVNCNKISAQEDDTVITTKATGSSTSTTGSDKNQTTNTLTSTYISPLVAKKGWPIIEAQPIDSTNSDGKSMTQAELDGQVKELVHDYPNIQYTVDGVDFKKYSNLNGSVAIGDYGYLRTRQGIDVKTRVQSITWYPQDKTKTDTVTFGNLILNPNTYLAHSAKQLEKYEIWYSDMSTQISDFITGLHNMNDNYNNLANELTNYQEQNNANVSNLQNQFNTLEANQNGTQATT